MSTTQQVTEEAYQRLVFSDPDRQWELQDGQLREKPGATWDHGHVRMELGSLLMRQLDRAEYVVFFSGRVRQPPATIFVPDLMVVPAAYGREFRGRPETLAIFSDPLPLIAEIWTSIGDCDVDAKISVYQQRGDLEIWRIHPYDKTLTTWRRQPNGTYDNTAYQEGAVTPVALPGVTIQLADLFDA
jgi:Uma2 family endonuclease